MNLRILKKLSKRAAPLLPLLQDYREQFKAEKQENYTDAVIKARKHWDRMRTVWTDIPAEKDGRRYFRTRRDGAIVCMSNDYIHPRKGTVMVGSMDRTDSPEWSEQTAWDSLYEIVTWSFMAWNVDGSGTCWPKRDLRTPSDIFKAADDLIREQQTKGH